jgi:Spy/CpxP family protein refolding chaperone
MKLTKLAFTKRALIVGLLAGSGILAASSFAMTAVGPEGKGDCEARHGQQIHAKWEARRAEHLSGLKGKLALKPEQEVVWNAFASASQPGMRSMGGDRQAMRGEFEILNTPQRLDKMLAMSDMRRARMVERAEAIKAFYAQLTPEQQSVFDAEAMPDRTGITSAVTFNPE